MASHTRDWIFNRRRIIAQYKLTLNCLLCKPNRGENSGRWVRHGEQKPRYKNIDRSSVRR